MSEKSIGESNEITREPRIIDRRSYLKTVGATGGGLALGGLGLSETGIESARAATTIIDDFEDGDLSEYDHDTTRDGRAAIVSSPTYDGSYAMEINNENAELISTSGLAAYPAAGDTFSYWIRGTGGADDVNLSYGVQDHNNRYFVRVDIANNDLMLARYQSGSITWLNKNTGGFTLSQDTWYEVEVAWSGSGDHTATIYDGSGNQVAQVSASGDSTWTSGGIGYDAYLGSGESVYFDYVTLSSSGGSSSGSLVVDDFEDGDISEYDHDPEFGGRASLASSPTYEGSYSLEISSENAELISTSGLDTYPAEGDTFSFWVQASGGGDNLNVTWGVQNHDNRYYAKLKPSSGSFYLFTYKNGSGSSQASDTSLSLSQDTWYEIEIDWATDGTQTATLYDSGGSQLSQISMTDTTWTSGGVGYDAYLGSGESVFFDYVALEGSGTTSSVDGLTIDGFEDGDISEYSFENGNESAAEIVSSPIRHGDKALHLSGEHFHLNSTSGLQNYPRTGDTFSGWIRASADINNSLVLLYGVQDFENRYYAYVNIDTDTLRIRKKVGGNITTLAEATGLGLSTGTWYEVEVDWETNGTHTVTVYDTGGGQVGQVSISNETRWTSGGIGYNAHTSNGASGYFDSVAVSETRHLGSFELEFDGWTTTNSNSLSRVSGSQQPAAVTHGDSALEVTVNSDPEPSIENKKRIQRADLQNNPCLHAEVLPASVENSDSPVTFRFRYHHTDPGGVEESPEMTVKQEYGGGICWDMSGLSDTKLANPDRLEITWYPTDHPPSSDFDYNGRVFVDNVRVTDDLDEVTTTRCARKHRNLERAHGLKTGRVIKSESDTLQEGVYQYSDGTEVPYEIEKFDNGDIEERVDGDAFRWKGGSA